MWSVSPNQSQTVTNKMCVDSKFALDNVTQRMKLVTKQ